VVAEKREKCKW